MSLDTIERSKTDLFTVVGAPYVAEHHADSTSHLQEPAEPLPPEAGIAAVWVVAYLIIFGAPLIAKTGIDRIVAFALSYLR